MERPIKEVKLPVSGYNVGIYTYYLRGDRVALERIMTDRAEFDSEGKLKKVDVGYRYDMDDEAVIRATKYIKEGETELSVNKETIHGLPEDDFEFLREQLPKGAKKKLITKPSEDTSKKPKEKGE